MNGNTPYTKIFGKYVILPQIAGRTFIPLGFFARLPMAMLAIGVLTIVTSHTGSYALGGMASGSVGIGAALGAVFVGYITDKIGQRKALLWLASANTFFILATISLAYNSDFFKYLLVTAFFMGATIPQIGSLSRVRWAALTDSSDSSLDSLEVALSYESTADELTFVFGPSLVGILAVAFFPEIPLILAAMMTFILVIVFALHPSEKVTSVYYKNFEKEVSSSNKSFLSKDTVLLIMVLLFIGTLFGGVQNSLSAFSGYNSRPEYAGILYSVLGVGSAISALSVPYWKKSWVLLFRWKFCSVGLVVVSAFFLLPINNIFLALIMLFFVGVFVGPILVTAFAIAGVVSVKDKQTTMMTSLASGLVAGTALGATVAGLLAQEFGYRGAFVAPFGAAVLLVLLNFFSGRVFADKLVSM